MTRPSQPDLTIAHVPVAAVSARRWDVIIIGAGPAGSAAAISLARLGRRVLLLDRRSFPREKICGDGLIADSIRALERLGAIDAVRELGHACNALSAFSPSGVQVDVQGEFITLKRAVLDALLVRRAIEAGATFAHAEVTRIDTSTPDEVRVECAGTSAPLRAQIGLVATGADVALPAQFGGVKRTTPTGIALRCYVHSSYPIENLILAYDRQFLPGYSWIFPMGNGEYNVGCGTFFRRSTRLDINLRAMYEAFSTRFAPMQALLKEASHTTPLRGAPLRCGLVGASPILAPRLLAVGETIGTTYPFTGEGIGKAMETAETAAACADRALASNDLSALSAYPKELESLAPKYVGYRIAESWLANAWLTEFFARRARRSARIRRAVEGLLSERVDPRRVFSLGGILRSFRN